MFLEIDPQKLYPVLVALILVGAAVAYHIRKEVVLPKRERRESDRIAEEKREAEIVRINALPKLQTGWLLRAPESYNGTLLRSYGTRYNRLFIVDDEGRAWVGLAIPEVLESLKPSEYRWADYYVPFKGSGEAYAGNPVEIDGLKIWIYPVWMKEGSDILEWMQWGNIEKKFHEVEKDWDYGDGLKALYKHASQLYPI